MTKHQQYRVKVNKVPLATQSNFNDTSPQSFPRMPRLYLEIIENKAKIKQDLVNKEYVPTNLSSHNESPVYKKPITNKEDTNDFSKKLVESYEDKDDNFSIDDNDMKELADKLKNNKKSVDLSEIQSVSTSSTQNEGYEKSPSIEDEDPVTSRLKQLLADTDSEKSEKNNRNKKEDKYSRSLEHYKSPPSLSNNNINQPPSLAELEARGMYQKTNELRDISRGVTMTEREEEDMKREYLFKFEILKKSYKEAVIPEYSIHTDIETLKKSYESTVRSLSLDSYVGFYKKVLIGSFIVIEYGLGKYGKFDMEGYTKQQIVSMTSYEQLLIELGEKSYSPTGTGYPVEIRLLGLIIIFLIGKMIMKNTGSNLMGLLNGFNTQQMPTQKRKMKGPDINLNDIPDLDELKQDEIV